MRLCIHCRNLKEIVRIIFLKIIFHELVQLRFCHDISTSTQEYPITSHIVHPRTTSIDCNRLQQSGESLFSMPIYFSPLIDKEFTPSVALRPRALVSELRVHCRATDRLLATSFSFTRYAHVRRKLFPIHIQRMRACHRVVAQRMFMQTVRDNDSAIWCGGPSCSCCW